MVDLLVRRGPGFHAGEEIKQLFKAHGGNKRGLMSCLYKMCEMRQSGVLRTGSLDVLEASDVDRTYLYREKSAVMAVILPESVLRIPPITRRESKGVVLLGTTVMSRARAIQRIEELAFIETLRTRAGNGENVIWIA